MDGQTQGTTVPVQGSNPLLDSANAEVAAQTQAATNAAEVLRKTPMYSTSSSAQPQMPVPSLRSKLFSGASVHNLDNQRPVTRAGARNKAIGQIAGMGANIVGKYFQKKEAEKTQALAQDIHRTLELTEGMDQAKTVLSDANASPQDKQQAQALLQKNQALLTAVLNGKNGKDIAKAYDITFGKESQSSSMDDKNASMHHQAMQDAMKQRGIDREKAFEQQIPQKMQVNPAYQSAYKQYQDSIKNLQSAQKNYTTAVGKQLEYQGKVETEEMKEIAAGQREHDREVAAVKVAAGRDETAAEVAKIHANATVESAQIRASAALKAVKEAKTEQAKMQVGAKMYAETTKNITDLESQNTKLTTDLNMAKKDKTKSAGIQKQINDNNEAIKEYKSQQSLWSLYATDDPQAGAALQLIMGDDNE